MRLSLQNIAIKSALFALTLLFTGTALARPALPLPREPRRPDPSEPMAAADMGMPAEDAGMPDPVDAGAEPELDAGAIPAIDAGTPSVDAGVVMISDAGVTPIDAASSPADDAATVDASDVDADTMIETPRPPTSDVFTTHADQSACSVAIAHRRGMPLTVALALLLVLFALRHRRERR